jgi:hypothetical protein
VPEASLEKAVHHPEDEHVEQEHPRADPEVEPQAVRIAHRGVECLLLIGAVQRGRRQPELYRRYKGVVADRQYHNSLAEPEAQPVDITKEAGGQDNDRHPGPQEDREGGLGIGEEPGDRNHHDGAGQAEERQRDHQR